MKALRICSFRLFLSLLTLTSLFEARGAELPLQIREDLIAKLGPLLCTQKLSPQSSIADILGYGIFDAGIQFLILDSKKPLSHPKLNHAAQKITRDHDHLGYAYGFCAKNSYWIATTPAPVRIERTRKKIILPLRELARYCRRYRVDFAEADFGRPRSILKTPVEKGTHKAHISTTLLPRGSMSLSCEPRPSQTVPSLLWALWPINKGPYDAPPLIKQFDDKADNLFLWSNQIRDLMGLPPLALKAEALEQIAHSLLKKNPTIHHNRKAIKKVAHELKRQKGRFIGENRVRARSFSDAAWLLWNSPPHRSLLLHKRATHLATASRKVNHDQLSVMVFARF